MLEKIKFGAIALIGVIAINLTISNQPILNLRSPQEVVENNSDEDPNIDLLQGVWRYESDSGHIKYIQLRGNQLSYSDNGLGWTYYTIAQIEEDFTWQGENEEEFKYNFYWDANDFADRYGEKALNQEALPIELIYDQGLDSLANLEGEVFHRDELQESLIILEENLIARQPINALQLDNFSSDKLIELYLPIQEEGLSVDESMEKFYNQLTLEPEGKSLLRGKDYDEYMQVASQIRRHTDLTLAEINQADPSAVLSWYRTALAQFEGQSEAEIITNIEPRIHGARQEYLDQVIRLENLDRQATDAAH